ncbi:MAG: signal recognition particle receptor subunit alpha [Myxococcota bacterium]
MLETLSQGFKSAGQALRGVRALSPENTAEALRAVRSSLLEADVDLALVKDFLARVEARALGEKVATRVRDASGRSVKVTPGQHFIASCERELIDLMGPVDCTLARANGATSVLLIGLQGVGKTSAAAKLARLLQKQGRRPLLVAADVVRPAAIEQLQILGASIEVPVHVGDAGAVPVEICQRAAERARSEGFDALVYDTAGRLSIDDALMQELARISQSVCPANTLLVCDAMMGRDAVNVAKGFSERLSLDGVVLTKLDGDARGGAALALKAITGVPIKFIATGEGIERLEEFRPEGLASRILGMGDIVGLVKDFEEVVDERQAEADAERLLKGQFNLEDLLGQLKTVQKLGPMREVLSKLPMGGALSEQVDEGETIRVEALIHSMTPQERAHPELIDKSRASRIANGSGRRPKDVHNLVERFGQMRQLMASLGSGGGLLSGLPGMGKLAAPGMARMDPAALLAGAGAPGARSAPLRARNSEARRKRKRKQARKDRKKSRRR